MVLHLLSVVVSWIWALFQIQEDIVHSQPHIILIVADDLGWNDVSWHNHQMQTPNLERLARKGIILEQHYAQYMCTPSRAALLTGRYPHRMGMQHFVLKGAEPNGLPITETLLPEKLKQLGYTNHIVGKWHLGFCDKRYTPTGRGFDSYVGNYHGRGDYFTHACSADGRGHYGYDFHINNEVGWSYYGKYKTEIFMERIEKILRTHDPAKPLFLYAPFYLPHEPLQLPETHAIKISNESSVVENNRKIYSAMVSLLDEVIGNLVAHLKKYNLYQDSVLVFMSDNGGDDNYGSSNLPLRGNKFTYWDGGTRVPAFIHSPKLNGTSYVSNQLFHITDWFPTLVNLAGGVTDSHLDGINQWDSLHKQQPSERNEIVYTVDNASGQLQAGIRVGDYKLLVGETQDNEQYVGPMNPQPPPSRPPSPSGNNTEDTFKLFNLKDDPNELEDLANLQPEKVDELLERIKYHLGLMVPHRNKPVDPRGFPEEWKGAFQPGWCNAT